MTSRNGPLLTILLFGATAWAANVKIETVKLQLQLHNATEVEDFLKQQWTLPSLSVIDRRPELGDLPPLELQDPKCPLQTLTELSKNNKIHAVESFLRYQFPVDSRGKVAGSTRIDNKIVLFFTVGPAPSIVDQLIGMVGSPDRDFFIAECELKGQFPAPYEPYETTVTHKKKR